MAGCNVARVVNDLLARTESKPPSFTVHLYPEHWVLNNGSKFLYHNQTACLLDDIRARRIPVDFLDLFDSAKIPFYDGCMIVELLDYRPQRNKDPTPEKPLRSRVVLHPNSETLWADICSLNQKHGGTWTDFDALEIESKILLALSPPLCLEPDPHLTTVANHVLRASTPTVPVSLKRKAVVLEPEEDENEKTRRAKIMAFGNPSRPKVHTPSYRLLDLMAKNKPAKSQPHALPGQLPGHQYINQPQSSVATTAPIPQQVKAASPVGAPTTVDKPTPPQQTKAATPQTVYAPATYPRTGDSHTPIPPPSVSHQFINQHPPVNQAQVQSMQPQVYANLQAATDAAKRAVTPAQPLPPAQARPPPPQQPYSHLQSQSHYPPHTQLTSPTHAQQGLPQQAPQQHPQLQHHVPQQPQRPPSQPQPPQPSQTPIPIQTQPAHLQTQVVPSPIQHHSPMFQQHRPQSQPQPQQPIPHSHSSPQLSQLQQTPSHPQQTQTPQLSHQGSPLQTQAGTPHQYLQSPKPPTQSQTQPQTTPTPQPQSQPQPSQSHPQPPNTHPQAQTSTGQPIMQVHPQLMANFQGQIPPHLLQQQAAMARFKAAAAAAGQGQAQGQQQPTAQQQANVNASTPTNIPHAQLQMQMAQMQMQMPTAQQQQLQLLYAQQQYQRQLMAKTGRAGTPQVIPVQVGAAGASSGVGQQGTAGAVGARASPMVANANGSSNQQLAAAAAARGFQAFTPQQYLQQQQYLRTLAASSAAQVQQAAAQGVAQVQNAMDAQAKQIQNQQQQQGQAQGQQQQQQAPGQGQGLVQPGQQQQGQGQPQQQQQQGQGQVKQTPQMSQAQAMSHHYYLQQMGYNMPNMAGYQWPALGRAVGHGMAGVVNGQAMGMGGQQAQHTQQQVQQQMQMAMGSGVAQGVGKTAVQGQLPNR